MESGDFGFLKKGVELFTKKTDESVQRERSRMQQSKNPWPIYDSGLKGEDAFDQTFETVLPEEYRGIQQYVETELAARSGSAVGLELGGSGSQLFSSFTPGFFRDSYGCTLIDDRTASQKTEDDIHRHHIVPGNAFSSEGRRSLLKALDGKKIDVLFERMEGGLPGMITDAYAGAQLDWYYKIVNDEGIIFLQLPHIEYKDNKRSGTEEFVEKLNSLGTFDVAYKDGWNPVLRIQKKKNAPASLKTYFPN